MAPLPSTGLHYKLLGPAWTRAFRCLWMLEEIGADYELLQDFKPSSPRIAEHNPSGKVPVLLEYDKTVAAIDTGNATDASQHGQLATPSFVLTESTAVNTYLGHGSGLVPTDSHERALYDAVIAYLLAEVDAPLWLLAKHSPASPQSKHFGCLPELLAPCHRELSRAHARLVGELNPYLLGSQFTAADILYSHCLEWQQHLTAALAKAPPQEARGEPTQAPPAPLDERLLKYLETCRQRPAYQRAHVYRSRPKSTASTTKNSSL